MSTEARYTISEAASQVGVTPETLRAWERKKKVPAVPRDRNGFRFWRQADIERAREFRDRVAEPAPVENSLQKRRKSLNRKFPK